MKIKNRIFTSLLIIGIVSSAHAYNIRCQIGKPCTFPGAINSTSTQNIEKLIVEANYGSDYICTLTDNDFRGMTFTISGSSDFNLTPIISTHRIAPSEHSLNFRVRGTLGNATNVYFTLMPRAPHNGGTLICKPSYEH